MRDITLSDRTLIETTDDITRYTVPRIQPPDSGTYCLVARNEHACDRICVTITVQKIEKEQIEPIEQIEK